MNLAKRLADGHFSCRKLRLFAVAVARFCNIGGKEIEEAELWADYGPAPAMADRSFDFLDHDIGKAVQHIIHPVWAMAAQRQPYRTDQDTEMIFREILEGPRRCHWCGGDGMQSHECDEKMCLLCHGHGWIPPRDIPDVPGIKKLASNIYHGHSFNLLPVLADAMERIGYVNQHVLNHLRCPETTHYRGCWALDYVLELS